MAFDVEDVQIDEANEGEIARHGMQPNEVRQVLAEEPEFFRNTKGHEAEVVMIRPTFGGRFLTVPLKRTAEEDCDRGAMATGNSVDISRGRDGEIPVSSRPIMR